MILRMPHVLVSERIILHVTSRHQHIRSLTVGPNDLQITHAIGNGYDVGLPSAPRLATLTALAINPCNLLVLMVKATSPVHTRHDG